MSTTATASAPYSEPVAHPSMITWTNRSTSQPQVGAADALVRLDLSGLARQHDPAGFEHVRVVEDLEQLTGEVRRQPQRGLVEQHQPRLEHERARDREHLLLAAAHRPGLLRAALLEAREVPEAALDVLGDRAAVAARVRADTQVLLDGQRRERPAPLGHVGDGPAGR